MSSLLDLWFTMLSQPTGCLSTTQPPGLGSDLRVGGVSFASSLLRSPLYVFPCLKWWSQGFTQYHRCVLKMDLLDSSCRQPGQVPRRCQFCLYLMLCKWCRLRLCLASFAQHNLEIQPTALTHDSLCYCYFMTIPHLLFCLSAHVPLHCFLFLAVINFLHHLIIDA